MSDRVLRRRASVPNYAKIFKIHGFYVRQLTTINNDRPYFVYDTFVEYMGQEPSNQILQYVNNERCDDYINDWDNIETILMLDGADKATTVVHQYAAPANDYRWNRRRNRRPQQVQVENSDNDEENHDGEVDDNPERWRCSLKWSSISLHEGH